MKKKVIALVGTSIFENYMKENGIDIYDTLKVKSFREFEGWKEDIDDLQENVSEWAKEKVDASAEIKSLLKIKEELKQDKLSVYLLASDTILSPLAAEIIKEWFNEKEGFEIYFEKKYGKDVIEGLQVKNGKNFEDKGLMNLFERIEEITGGNTKNIIFNITGGYKAVVPFLTFYAQIYEVPAYYIFENEDELIKLPQLPISLDFNLIEDNFFAFEVIHPKTFEDDLPTTEKFLSCLRNPSERNEAVDIFKSFQKKRIITVIDDKVKLTVYGRLIFSFFNQKTGIQQLKGTLVELKIFEFIFNKYRNNSEVEIYHSKEFGERSEPKGEADVFVVDKKSEKIRVIEVKSGGSRGTFEKIKNNTIQKLLPAIKEWAERKSFSSFKIYLDIYLYRAAEILENFKEEKAKCEELNEVAEEINWYWLKINNNLYHQVKIKEGENLFEWE